MRRALLVGAAVAACTCSATAAEAQGGGRQTSGVLHIAVVNTVHGVNYAAGYANDRLLGSVAATYVIRATSNASGSIKVVAKKVTFYMSNGSISGTGSATQTTKGHTQVITNGVFRLTQGRGGQAGHSLVGTFSGAFSAKQGAYEFRYRATYR